jgi:hypothetical protein
MHAVPSKSNRSPFGQKLVNEQGSRWEFSSGPKELPIMKKAMDSDFESVSFQLWDNRSGFPDTTRDKIKRRPESGVLVNLHKIQTAILSFGAVHIMR